ncbi:expressed unknown protein [Seminavis robusta]|uniref:Uncharacterized protein n=1 Tax=Seminavis robusta TaxID=568900 RepID=A0A9N8EMZ4_9STRA|nr:expressed unknown protein [Seminavis robusta]|eukprot:Sro1398_g269240.1 n/a (504) ;mRNA; f:7150-8748
MKLASLATVIFSARAGTATDIRVDISSSEKRKLTQSRSDASHHKMKDPRALISSINCSPDSVAEWIDEEVQRKGCDIFLEPYQEACGKYEDYNSTFECQFLSAFMPPSGAAALVASNELEECEYFVSRLLPNSYFTDYDSLNVLFGSSGEFPSFHSCRQSRDMCEVKVLFEADDTPRPVWATAPPTLPPYTERVPCTRCDFFYEDDANCFDADCSIYDCLGPETDEPTQAPTPIHGGNESVFDVATSPEVSTARTSNIPDVVNVCVKNSRSDQFSYTEYRKGLYYGCVMKSEEKLFTTEFQVGATNVQVVTLKIGELYTDEELDNPTIPEDDDDDLLGSNNDEEEDTFDYCEVTVDGETCDSCTFCEDEDPSNMAIDCTNVVPGALTSCQSLTDFYHGIIHKLIVLQEGFVFTQAPTPSPTPRPTARPTPRPTARPTPSPAVAATQSGGNSGGEPAAVETSGNPDISPLEWGPSPAPASASVPQTGPSALFGLVCTIVMSLFW